MVGESAATIMARRPPARMRDRWPLLTSLAATLVVVGLAALLVANRPHKVSLPPDTTRQRVTIPQGQPAEAGAAKGALAAYHGYLTAYASAGQTANPLDPRLERFARGGALIQVRTSLRTLALNGLVYRGGFQGEVHVTSVSITSQTVFLMNCQDISGLTLIQKATGKQVATSPQNTQFPVAVEAQFFQGRWIIVQTTVDRTSRC